MKGTLIQKNRQRLIILAIVIILATYGVAGTLFFNEQLKTYTESAFSYVRMIMLEISGETIEELCNLDAVKNEVEFDKIEASDTTDPDDILKEALEEVPGLSDTWAHINYFILQTIIFNKNLVDFQIFIPKEDHVYCLWHEVIEDSAPLLSMTKRPYREQEKDLLDSIARSGPDNQLKFIHNKDSLVGTAILPIYDMSGEIAAFAELDISINNIHTSILNLMADIAIIICLIMAVVLVFYYRLQKKQIIGPIMALDEAAANAVDKLKEGEKPFQTDIRTGDEIESLAHSFEKMGESLKSYISENAAITTERERINTELEMAAKIQSDMLPDRFPAFPDRSDFDIYASMTPAKEVGGDFYDFFLIDENVLALVIADVSGKGVPASLFMMRSMIMIENLAAGNTGPAAVLDKVNKQIFANNESQMFVTVWLGILDLKSGVLKAANAGHEYPILRKPGGLFEVYKDKHSFVAGVMEQTKYKEYELTLEPGTTLFLYTDGLPEAKNKDGERFRLDKTLEVLNRSPDAAPKEILHSVEAVMKDYTTDTEPFDDLTMLCLYYAGKPMEITVDAAVDQIPKVKAFLKERLTAADCPAKVIKQICVSTEELFGNIAMYAYEGTDTPGTAVVELRVEEEPKRAVITFSDSGIPFDPLANKDPDVTLKAKERTAGGLGIFLARKFMDEISYEYARNQNRLTISKKFY